MKFKLYVLIAVFLIVLARGQAQDFLGNNDDNMSLEEQPHQNSGGARCMLRKPVTLSNNGPSSVRTKYYYYSQSKQKCRSFYYFGVPPPGIFMSQNIFTSRLICQNTCHGSPYVITTTATNNTNRVFQEHIQAGNLKQFFFETYYIKNVGTGLYVDAIGSSQDDNAQFILWNFKGTANQQFHVVQQPGGKGGVSLIAVHSGKCVTLSNGADLDNINVIQWPCWGENYQHWRRRIINEHDGTFSIYSSKGSGECMVASEGAAAGAHLIVRTCSHDADSLPNNQLWTFTPI